MSGSVDRRPWLILSRREARALLAALEQLESLTPDQRTARDQVRVQLAWIDGGMLGAPSIEAAVEREYARS